MIEHNSPLYWVVSLAVFVGLLVGMRFYVRICWMQWEPAGRAWVEQHYEVKLNYSRTHFWSIDQESWDGYQGNRTTLWFGVTAFNFAVIMGLVLLLLVALAGLWLVLFRLFRPSQ